jgi:hypothetical protein
VREGEREQKDELRAVAVDLSASQLRLKPGKTALLTARVSGLKGLRHPVRLWLENRTPATLSLEGGPRQAWDIDEKRVAPDGTFTLTRTITGIVEGDFDIGWSVVPARRRGVFTLDLPRALAGGAGGASPALSADDLPATGGAAAGRGGALRFSAEPFRLEPGRHAALLRRGDACLRVSFALPRDVPDLDYRWVALHAAADAGAPGRVLLAAPADLDSALARPLEAAVFAGRCAAPPPPPSAGFRCLDHGKEFPDLAALGAHLVQAHPGW